MCYLCNLKRYLFNLAASVEVCASRVFRSFLCISTYLILPLRIWTILYIISLYISVAELQRLSWQGGPAARSSCRGQNAKHVETWRELKSKQSRKSCFNLWKLEASNGICTESCLNSCVVSATVSMQVVLDRICCWDTESSAQGQRMIDHEHSNEIPTSVKQILSQKAINSALSTDAAYWALTHSYSWWPKTKLQNDWTPIPLIFFQVRSQVSPLHPKLTADSVWVLLWSHIGGTWLSWDESTKTILRSCMTLHAMHIIIWCITDALLMHYIDVYAAGTCGELGMICAVVWWWMMMGVLTWRVLHPLLFVTGDALCNHWGHLAPAFSLSTTDSS